jgi:hypothetical protein
VQLFDSRPNRRSAETAVPLTYRCEVHGFDSRSLVVGRCIRVFSDATCERDNNGADGDRSWAPCCRAGRAERGADVRGASVRRVEGSSRGLVLRITAGGRLQGVGDLKNIIQLAYGVAPDERIVAADPGASRRLSERFDLTAIPPTAASPPRREVVMEMTRQTLAERFGLKVRVDTDTHPRRTTTDVNKPMTSANDTFEPRVCRRTDRATSSACN